MPFASIAPFIVTFKTSPFANAGKPLSLNAEPSATFFTGPLCSTSAFAAITPLTAASLLVAVTVAFDTSIKPPLTSAGAVVSFLNFALVTGTVTSVAPLATSIVFSNSVVLYTLKPMFATFIFPALSVVSAPQRAPIV